MSTIKVFNETENSSGKIVMHPVRIFYLMHHELFLIEKKSLFHCVLITMYIFFRPEKIQPSIANNLGNSMGLSF